MDKLSDTFNGADPFQSWLPFIIAISVGILMTIRSFMGGQICPSTNKTNNQIIIVTGASGGIGLQIAKELCVRSAHVIMACKDIAKAEDARKWILKSQPDAHVECRHLDLKSFDCVRRFVRSIEKEFTKVDVLINNAGLIFNAQEKTVDGFEMHLQVNYLGHALLTHLLMTRLECAEQGGRIINASAHAYSAAKMNAEDPLNIGTWATAYHHRDAFAHSKLAVVLFTRHLSTLLKDSRVTVNAYTPGFVRGTDHLRRSPVMNALCAKVMTYPWMWLFMKNAQQGAQSAVYLATEPSLKTITGQFYNDCEQSTVSALGSDDSLAASLYTETMRALKLDVKMK